MEEKLTCPICGAPTRVYMGNPRKDKLCAKHADELKAGKIALCQDCGKYHNVEEICSCQKTTNEISCLLCGHPSNGYHFCKTCYAKYKDGAIDIRIKNCKEIEWLDKYGNQTYKCDDGRKVRSKSEMIISNFLFKHGIRAIYEKAVYYYNNNETIELHPDFYLPDYDLYIEHNGTTNEKSYKNRKEKTEKMYKELGYNLVITTETDLHDIEAKLKPILKIN